ncbi:Inorganic pyrophosphatase [bacterium HR34]|nr:Inorganic pyrophosphatase [bacterium HR34]
MNISKLPAGELPDKINVFIEIPQGSFVKYERDEESGFIFVDRFMFTSMSYPFNYGFVPNTKAKDGDPVDVLVISSYSVVPGTVIKSRVIGMLEMEDEEGIDNKIIALPIEKVDPFYAHIKDVDDLPQAIKDKIKHFFERYKELEKGKWVRVNKFLGKDEAVKEIEQAF